MMKHSFCGDEIFIHTLVVNSKFREKIYSGNINCSPSFWVSTWPIESVETKRDGHNFHIEDLPLLLETEALFARKFEHPDGKKIIDIIKSRTNNAGRV